MEARIWGKYSVKPFHPHLTSPSRGRKREETSTSGGRRSFSPPILGGVGGGNWGRSQPNTGSLNTYDLGMIPSEADPMTSRMDERGTKQWL